MRPQRLKETHDLNELIFKYEVMSQKGTVFFIEKTGFLELIHHYEKEGSTDKALDVVDHALSLHEFVAELHISKARLLLSINCPEDAIECLEQSRALGSKNLVTELLYARALTLLDELEEALNILDQCKVTLCNNEKELSDILLLEACIFEKQKMYERAFYTLQESILKNTRNQKALERIWFNVECNRRHEKSLNFHKEIIEIDPYSSWAWFNLGHAYYFQHDYQKAIEAFEYAFLIDENFDFAYRDCAEVCMTIQDYNKALQCYLELTEHRVADPDILQKIGECYLVLCEYSKAKIYLLRAVNIDPQNDEALFFVGQCFANEGQIGSAVHFYKKAIELEDQREDYLSALANAYYKLGIYRKIPMLFNKVIELAPHESQYWYQYACFLIKRGKINEAIFLLNSAEKEASGTELLFCKAAALFLTHQNLDEAYSLLEEALLDNYKMYPILFELAPHLTRHRKLQAMIIYFRDEQ